MRSIVHASIVILLLSTAGCGRDSTTTEESSAGVVEIVARGLTFEAPAETPSGWTTLRFRNESGMVHFALLERLPEGYGIADQQRDIAPVFQQGMDLLNRGEADAAMAKFGELPEWFGAIEFVGGPGLLSPGRTGETTVRLEPGTYLIECYVKTDGVFHSYNPSDSVYGMVHELRVNQDSTSATAPAADSEIALSRGGISMPAAPGPGEHTFAVRFVDQGAHENFVGHDLHLLRVADGVDLQVVNDWMDWSRPGGLETPAPAEFVGGVNEMPAGGIAYVTVQLEPGRYAWVAEVPDPRAKGLLHEFTVAGSE